jgi:hypothetical protein
MDHMPFWTAADEVTARDALVDEEIEEDLQALSQCSSGHALGTHEALSPAICNNCQNEFPAGEKLPSHSHAQKRLYGNFRRFR